MLSLFVFATAMVYGQAKTVTIHGKVISFEESLPLEGVSIHVKGTTFYTGTQADGTFSLDVKSDGKLLVLELNEYETAEVALDGKSEYDIVLKRADTSAHFQTTSGVIEKF